MIFTCDTCGETFATEVAEAGHWSDDNSLELTSANQVRPYDFGCDRYRCIVCEHKAHNEITDTIDDMRHEWNASRIMDSMSGFECTMQGDALKIQVSFWDKGKRLTVSTTAFQAEVMTDELVKAGKTVEALLALCETYSLEWHELKTVEGMYDEI